MGHSFVPFKYLEEGGLIPWQEVKPMDQKVLFLADWLRKIASFTELCERYGVSRKTGYKWIKRYEDSGFDGLYEQSRRPKGSPQQTPYPVRKAIIGLRTRGRITLGPKKIQILLAQRLPNEHIPSKTTIYKILSSEGLVQKRRRKQRVAPFEQPFAPTSEPNDLWSADFKGQFKLADGCWCYPLTIMDHQSRYLLCCQGLYGTRFVETQQAFKQLFQKYGLPKRIRTDNGVPFATTAAAGLSRLAVWWITLGILPERIQPGKPQQNGRHERMHRTLKQAATKPPEASLEKQQAVFDQFCRDYNEERPHEALGQQPPSRFYQPSPRAYAEAPKELTYPDDFEVRTVQSAGVVYFLGKLIYVSHLLKGHRVGLCEIAEGLWDVYFGPIRLGSFDVCKGKDDKSSYLTLKV